MNYSILKELGHGGMATVYLAEHNLLKNKVALKVLKEEFTRNKNIRNRFLSEARNLATMSHPNIIKVTDLIDEGDSVAFVMEHIDGETLKEYLDRKGKLTDDEIRIIFSQMLEAVGYVHEQGLVHRDIKPSNFMIDKKGKVKLLDFGIAKNTDSSSAEYTQTGTGMQMGTPMYMSPEQVKNTKEVTFQSDIYSLGVVLWQMVMGKKPYDQTTLSIPEIQVSIIKEPLSKTGSALDSIIQKATEKDTLKRIVTTKVFLAVINERFENLEKISNYRKNSKSIIEKKENLDTILEEKKIFQSTEKSRKSNTNVLTFSLIGVIIVVFLILFITPSRLSSKTEKIGYDSLATDHITYQLSSIQGQYTPRGGFCEYDSVKNLWCMRPHASEIMSYSKDHGIADEVPDWVFNELSTYFDKKTTSILNSCKILLKKESERLSFVLTYNDVEVYKNEINKSDYESDGYSRFREKKLDKFEIDLDIPIILSNGNDFEIVIGNSPTISYSNEIGSYELKFKKI